MILPAGWAVEDLPRLAVGPDDCAHLFHRGTHPLMVFNQRGEVKDSWGYSVI